MPFGLGSLPSCKRVELRFKTEAAIPTLPGALEQNFCINQSLNHAIASGESNPEAAAQSGNANNRLDKSSARKRVPLALPSRASCAPYCSRNARIRAAVVEDCSASSFTPRRKKNSHPSQSPSSRTACRRS
jgi:hypothetical protein